MLEAGRAYIERTNAITKTVNRATESNPPRCFAHRFFVLNKQPQFVFIRLMAAVPGRLGKVQVI
ncbi:hypothetical protein [Horticoccus sp. 23ND18S-11]|uniref:hypothetical protein n=1 Tax=Horticoccus sp. 23ND18S-11 TaxID=3391832 RepID=UPI0039C8FBD1